MAGLILENVSHTFSGGLVVDDVSLTIAEGEIFCLLGPSGCGKSTTLRIAAGLEELQHGRVLIRDKVVATARASVPPEERGVGLVFQDYALFPHLTVADNVAFGLDFLNARERRERVTAMLDRLGMAQYAADYPHILSGGEQQRVALARALAPAPRLMLMDEPFSGLDIRLRDQVRDQTLDLLKATGTATLMVTHDPEEAMRMADRIAVMRRGRVIQQGTPKSLYESPADPFVARFFSEVNSLVSRVSQGIAETPLGAFPVPDLAEAADVEILIRPEALLISANGSPGDIPARVTLVRSLGAYALVRLAVDGLKDPLLARVAGEPPKEGDVIGLGLDRRKAFAFGIPPNS